MAPQILSDKLSSTVRRHTFDNLKEDPAFLFESC
jgi:hypothetical protein